VGFLRADEEPIDDAPIGMKGTEGRGVGFAVFRTLRGSEFRQGVDWEMAAKWDNFSAVDVEKGGQRLDVEAVEEDAVGAGVNAADAGGRIAERDGDLGIGGFEIAAVDAPWRIELDEEGRIAVSRNLVKGRLRQLQDGAVVGVGHGEERKDYDGGGDEGGEHGGSFLGGFTGRNEGVGGIDRVLVRG